MSRPSLRHEAMATHFELMIDGQAEAYTRQAATAVFREIDRLEGELSQFVASSDIARANRLRRGETTAIGEDALECLLLAADVSLATRRAFDAAYRSVRASDAAPDDLPFTLDPESHTLTSRAERLHLDLGAIGKGYALDCAAALLCEWGIASACLNSGGSTVLALAAPSGQPGWTVGLGDASGHRPLALADAALSGSGIAVKGVHLIDPRSGEPALRNGRVWSLAPTATLADALSTAFFVMTESDVAAFCAAHPETGAALTAQDGTIHLHGALRGRTGP